MKWDTNLVCFMIGLRRLMNVTGLIESTKMNRKTAEELWITLIMESVGQNVAQAISQDTSRHLELKPLVHGSDVDQSMESPVHEVHG